MGTASAQVPFIDRNMPCMQAFQPEAGDVGAVNAAVKAATDANESLNLRITEHYVIPNPDPELLEFI